MKTEEIKKMAQAWLEVQEASKKKMDPVDQKALKKDFKDRNDKDIDNDGDVDKSDEYLHNRRKAVSKAMKKGDKETEVEVQEKAVSQAQQMAAGAALAAKRGETDPKDLNDVSRKMYDNLSVKELEKFAGTKHKDLPYKAKKESVEIDEGNKPGPSANPNDTENMDKGLSPNAKKEKERKTEAPAGADVNKVMDLNFKTFRSMGKVSPKRPGDQTGGDKTMPKNDGK